MPVKKGSTTKAKKSPSKEKPKTQPKKTATKKAVKAPAKKPAKKTTGAKKPAAKPVKKKSEAKAAPKKKSAAPSAPSVGLSVMGVEPYKEKRGEEYMSEGQLAHFNLILSNWKNQLMEEVDRTVTHMKDEAANFPDPNDRATQEEEFSFELRTRDRERKLIKKIEEAIERIRNKDYGFCEMCGIEIGIRRLEARPTATLCIDCKTLAEIKERQIGG